MVYLPAFDISAQHQKSIESVISAAADRVDKRITGTTQHDFTSGGVELTDDQMREAMSHEVINCTASGRVLTIPDGSGETQGPIFVGSDPANTQSFSLVKGSFLTAIGPGEYRAFWNEDSVNGLIEISSGGGSLVVPVSKRKTFAGCRASHNTTQNATNGDWYAMSFNTDEFDDGGWHDTVTNNGRLTVPAGVTRVRVGANIRSQATSNLAASSIGLAVTKNGGTIGELPGGITATQHFSGSANGLTLATRDIDVEPGDYFEAWAGFWGTSTPTIEAGHEGASFWIWDVSEPPYAATPAREIRADFFSGTPSANEVIYAEVIVDDLRLADDFLNSQAHVTTNPSSATVFNIDLNAHLTGGGTIGTVSFATDGTPTFSTTGSGQETLAPGDVLEIVAPATLNGIAGIAITLQASHA
jgi:hypothetical protein